MQFEFGDVLRHNRFGELLFYFILGVDDESEEYRYSIYSEELFENYIQSGQRAAEYMERRVEMEPEDVEQALKGTHVDHQSEWEYIGNAAEIEPSISIGQNQPFHTVSLEQLRKVLYGEGWKAVKDAQIYYETAGEQRTIVIHRVGHSSEGLVDDMAMISDNSKGYEMVEHKDRILEAIRRGIWIPIRAKDAKVDGRKVSWIQ